MTDATEAARALAARRPTADYTCAVCGKVFETIVQTGSRTPRYCSPACKQRAKYQRRKTAEKGVFS